MKRVMVICPHPDDPTSFYRGVGPLAELQREIPDLTLTFATEVKWTTCKMVDMVFLQRPFTAQHQKIAQIARNCGTPLWVDFDDDLLAVPADNPTHRIYADENTRRQIAAIIKMADIVTVSTQQLKDRIERANPNVLVVPNALDDRVFGYRKPRASPRPKLVLWRGSATHARDLSSVGAQLIEASHDPDRADWSFQFHGFNPWWISEKMREQHTICSEAIDILEYMRFMHELNPALVVVPLAPNEFNLSKSNCSWIEATFAGAAVLAPDITEFQRPGIIRYGSPAEFGVKLKQAMTGHFDLETLNTQSWDHIRTELLLTRVNHLRRQVIETLHGRPRHVLV